jgi:uncharacterized membrane protein
MLALLAVVFSVWSMVIVSNPGHAVTLTILDEHVDVAAHQSLQSTKKIAIHQSSTQKKNPLAMLPKLAFLNV